MVSAKKEKIERLTIKVPKNIAEYFREKFPHGKRSKFFVQCVLDYKHNEEVEAMENDLRKAGTARQS